MGYVITIEEKLTSEAEFGTFKMYCKITKKKAEKLRQENLEVTDLKQTNNFPRIHRISWEKATVEGDIYSLNPKSKKYSLAQRLWITAMQNMPTC